MVKLLQHAFQDTNGLSEDRYVNTFHFLDLPLGGDDYAALAAAIKSFYYDANNPDGSIRSYMANHAVGDGSQIKVFDLDDPEPRVPVYDETYDPVPANSASDALPGEVACCLSFTAPPAPGVPMARRRGRIYIGPLNMDAIDAVAAVDKARPDNVFRTVCTAAFRRLADDSFAAGFALVQYSPTAGVASAPSSCWMDDAFDTQRRRGVAPTTRTTNPMF